VLKLANIAAWQFTGAVETRDQVVPELTHKATRTTVGKIHGRRLADVGPRSRLIQPVDLQANCPQGGPPVSHPIDRLCQHRDGHQRSHSDALFGYSLPRSRNRTGYSTARSRR